MNVVSSRTAELISDEKVQKVLIVANKAIPDIIDYTKSEYKNATALLLCLGNKKQKENPPANTRIVDGSDFGITGSIKNEKVLNLLQENFDLIIDLSENSTVLDYIISKCKSKLIVGKAGDNEENKIHDIFVPFLDNNESFISQTKASINLIAKNGN